MSVATAGGHHARAHRRRRDRRADRRPRLAPGGLRRPRLRAGQRPARGGRGRRARPERRQGPAPAGARRGAPRRRRRLALAGLARLAERRASSAGCRSPTRRWPAGARPSTTCTARTSTMRSAPPSGISTSRSAPAASPSSSTARRSTVGFADGRARDRRPADRRRRHPLGGPRVRRRPGPADLVARRSPGAAWRPAAVGHEVGLEVRQHSFWGPRKQFVAYYVSAGRLVNWVGITQSDDDWREESWSARGDRDEALALFAGWHPQVRALIAGTEQVFKWALFDRPPLETWTRGPGDAAGRRRPPDAAVHGPGRRPEHRGRARAGALPRRRPRRSPARDRARTPLAAGSARPRSKPPRATPGRNLQLSDPAEVAARNARMRENPEAPVARFDWIWGYDVEQRHGRRSGTRPWATCARSQLAPAGRVGPRRRWIPLRVGPPLAWSAALPDRRDAPSDFAPSDSRHPDTAHNVAGEHVLRVPNADSARVDRDVRFAPSSDARLDGADRVLQAPFLPHWTLAARCPNCAPDTSGRRPCRASEK